MPSPTDPSQSNVIPLSQAHAQRRGDELIEISESRIEDIVNKVLTQKVRKKFENLQQTNQEISEQIERLQSNQIISQLTAIKNGDTEDPALVVTTDLNKADFAVVGIPIYREIYYPYTTRDIAEALDIKINEVVKLVDGLGLRNNSQYHKPIKIGKKNFVQRYSQPAFNKIKQEIQYANGLVIPNQESDRRD